MRTVSACKAGAEYQTGITHCDTVLSHGAGVCLYGIPGGYQKRKSGYFGSNGLVKVYGMFSVQSITSKVAWEIQES